MITQEIDGLKINYRIIGEGQPILVLHGWGSQSEKWQKAGELLKEKKFQIIIPDLPGFGKSQEPFQPWNLDDYFNFLGKFVQFLKLKKFHLLGHSFGGAVAVKYALKFPEKIEKLILIAPALYRRDSLKTKFWRKIAKISKIFSFGPFYCQSRKIFYKFFIGKSDYPYAKGIMKETYLKIIKEDLSGLLEKIQIPTLIIWGEKDDIKNIKEAYLINEKIKNSELKTIPEVGHSPHLEVPEILTKIILEFL